MRREGNERTSIGCRADCAEKERFGFLARHTHVDSPSAASTDGLGALPPPRGSQRPCLPRLTYCRLPSPCPPLHCMNPVYEPGDRATVPAAGREPGSRLVPLSRWVRDGLRAAHRCTGDITVSTVAPTIRRARRGRRCRGALRNGPGPALCPAQATCGRRLACRWR
jgi:hypothetical protein